MTHDARLNRKDHWERVFTDKSPDEVSWYQKEPVVSLELIRNTGISKDAPLIDVGGGTSSLVDRLRTDGHSRSAVLDISAAALTVARSRLGENAENIEWFETDVTEFAAPHTFALWHDRATFHFLVDPVDRARYVEVMKRSLTGNGHVIIATFAIGGPTRCSGLAVVQYDAKELSAALGDEFRLVAERREKHLTPQKTQQRFVYFRFVRQASKKHMDDRLDEALCETFPASDPIAVTPL